MKRPKYVGQTKNTLARRWQGHKDEMRYYKKRGGVLTHKHNWLSKLESFGLLEYVEIRLLEECSVNVADDREKYWISKMAGSFGLCNLNEGGQAHKNHSEETKQKISTANKGVNNGMYGKRSKRDYNTKQKARLAMLASEKFKISRKSKTFRDKCSNAKSIPLLLLNYSTFEIVGEFRNANVLAEHLGYKKANILNAVRDLRRLGRGDKSKFWVVRKEDKDVSIQKILEKNVV
jgi:group I intron endonuclease